MDHPKYMLQRYGARVPYISAHLVLAEGSSFTGTSGKIPFQARQSEISPWKGAQRAYKQFPLAITPYLPFCM
jgi:hypothetical protein